MVVDASVLVALFHADEPYHQVTRNWFIQTTSANIEISTSVIALPEIAAAISRGKGNLLRAQQIYSLITQANVISLVPVSQQLAEQAADIAATCQIRGCDAIYVALAQKLNQPLVTLDNQQLQRAKSVIHTRKP